MKIFNFKSCIYYLVLVISLSQIAQITLANTKNVQIEVYSAKYNAVLHTTDKDYLAKPTILVVHNALSHNKSNFVGNISNLLKDNKYNVLAVNLSLRVDNRRSEDYKCSSKHNHTFMDGVNEIALWVKWLVNKGFSNIHLLGYRMGANQIASFIYTYQDSIVKSLIMVAPFYQNLLVRTYAKDFPVNNGGILTNIPFLSCMGASVSNQSFFSYYDTSPTNQLSYVINKIATKTLVISVEEDHHIKSVQQKISRREGLVVTILKDSTLEFKHLYIMDLFTPITKFIQ